jgi:ankyrin repeat protein
VAELLVANRADVDAKETKLGQTSLHFAAEEGHKDVAELLLANRADVDAKENKTALPPLQWVGRPSVRRLIAVTRSTAGCSSA